MIDIIQSQRLLDAGFSVHGFTTRGGGASLAPFDSLNFGFDVGDDPAAVIENLSRLSAQLGLNAPLAWVKQVHGNRAVAATQVLEAGGGWSSRPVLEADGLYAERGAQAVLAVRTADCAAVLLADPRTRGVAAVHAGWRGTKKGVIQQAVRALVGQGASPVEILAVIGPHIGAAVYEVGEEVARAFPESCDPIHGKPDKFLLDLGSAIEVSLLAAGLTSPNIELIEACTYAEISRFFSHRAAGGNTGRSLGFIAASTVD